MEAPVCRTCGKRHWIRVCDGDVTPVTKPRNAPITNPVTVTQNVTPPVTQIVTRCLECERLEQEIERLTAEVVHLKRELAKSVLPTMTAAERMKKMRERRKARERIA